MTNTLLKCCQGSPCKLCQIHRSPCIYDETADHRRRISKQRLLDEYQSQRVLLLGIIATIRAQNSAELQQLLNLIRSNVPLPQLSSYVEGMLAASPELSEGYRRLSWTTEDAQCQPVARENCQGNTRLAQEPERVSGLPMNAQITLGE